MIGMTLCSGIGAPEMAAPWIDWRFASEIEAFPREVLRQRFGYQLPEDQNQGEALLWGDMTEVTPDLLKSRDIPLPDILVAGTPCQDFSIAGLRAGTSGDRGNLTLKFVEIVHAIVDARPDGKLAVVWENVPGILSDKGNAFGNFLGGLVGGDAPIQPPRGESWPGVGMVAGPLGRAAWATLDAQWFGVAQRRRRVFVVVDFGGACDPAKVLFEPKGLCGNPPPSREKGEGVAATLEASTGGVSQKDCPEGRVAFGGYRMTAFGEYADDETASTLKERDHKDATDLAVAFKPSHYTRDKDGAPSDIYPPLTADADKGDQDPLVAYGFEDRSRGDDGRGYERAPHFSEELGPTVNTAKPPAVATVPAVRRLTPVECARLQGFPDDHCHIPTERKRKLEADELRYLRNLSQEEIAEHLGVDAATLEPLRDDDLAKLAADGPQYKAYGNSMAVPVMAWILDRVGGRYEVA